MAKTKEEIKAYVLSQNWGKMWVKNIQEHNNRYCVPNDFDLHLDKMFSSYSSALSHWIRCNAVKLRDTPEGVKYWLSIDSIYNQWYNTSA